MRIRLVEATDEIAIAGDTDADHRDDLVIGDSTWRDPDPCDIVACEGRAWLVRGGRRRRIVDRWTGRHGTAPSSLCPSGTVGCAGFASPTTRSGRPADVDGDGRDDFVTGPSQFFDDSDDNSDPEPICLLRGGRWPVRLVVRSTRPCLTTVLARRAGVNRDVLPAGDVNGDGMDDLLVVFSDSPPDADSSQPTSWYVLLGSAHPSPARISDLGERGFAIASSG